MYLAVVLAWLLATGPEQPLVISASGSTVEISGLTPGHDAVLFGLERDQEALQGGTTRLSRLRLQADETGRAVFTAAQPLLPHALWIAADEKSGRHAILAPPGAELPALPGQTAVARVKSSGDALELPPDLSYVLLIRAGHGVWFGAVADGGASDDDPLLDGKSRLKPPKLQDADKAAKKDPKKFEKADTIIVVEPVALRYAVIEVNE
ncbi:MAG TPA: hypothetical protein VGF69_08190 [Thermoanaerobaculia bacterium]|jgi:hypothetical protein